MLPWVIAAPLKFFALMGVGKRREMYASSDISAPKRRHERDSEHRVRKPLTAV